MGMADDARRMAEEDRTADQRSEVGADRRAATWEESVRRSATRVPGSSSAERTTSQGSSSRLDSKAAVLARQSPDSRERRRRWDSEDIAVFSDGTLMKRHVSTAMNTTTVTFSAFSSPKFHTRNAVADDSVVQRAFTDALADAMSDS